MLRKEQFIKGSLKLFIELIIVFIGVFLAFTLSNLSSQQAENTRFRRTLQVLHTELSDFVTYSPVPAQAMRDSIANYLRDRDAGKFPVPAYYREPRASTAPTAAWQASISSGAYELLEVSLFYRMTLHYNRVESLNLNFRHYMQRCEESIMPNLYRGNSVFYRNGKLLGEYIVLMQILEELMTEIDQLASDAKALREELELQLGVL